MALPIPKGYHAVQNYVCFKDARKAIEFYKKAFGAKEEFVLEGPRGKGVMHAGLTIGDSTLMVGDEMAGTECRSVESYGGSPVGFYVYVDDVDAAFKKAVAAGGKVTEEVKEAFWGDRTGTLKDPFGLSWSLATHTRDLSAEEIKKGAEEFMAHEAKR